MKTLKIVLALTLVVVIAMGGVFLMEGWTTPIIQERLELEANAALLEMYEGSDGIEIITDSMPEHDIITEIYLVSKGTTEVGVVYKAEFTGYNPGVVALIGVDTTNNTVAGFSVLMEADTAGLGKDLLNDPLFAEQFAGLTIEEVRDNGVDTTSGSTARITLSGVNAAMKKVLIYHGVNFLGEEAPIEETPEMIKERLKEEMFGSEVLTDITSTYETPDQILEVFKTSNDGVFITATFTGYSSEVSTYVVGLQNGSIIGYATLDSKETIGLGYDLVMHPDFAAQFAGLDAEAVMNDGVDVVAGSTAAITLGGVNSSLSSVIGYYVVNFLGGEAPVVETPEMIQERVMSEMFPAATFTDVTYDYVVSDWVWEMFEASTGGYAIVGIFNGFHPESLFIIGVNDQTMLGFASILSTETVGIGKDLVEHPDFAAQFVGLDINTIIDDGVDFVAGSTASMTLNGLNASLEDILKIYKEEVLGIEEVFIPLTEVPEDMLPHLEEMHTAAAYTVENIELLPEHILGIYTAVSDQGITDAVFYEVVSFNGQYFGGENISLIQIDPTTGAIVNMKVLQDQSSYSGTSNDSGVPFGEVDFSFLVGTNSTSTWTADSVDSAAGVSTVETMKELLITLEEVFTYQIDNNVGGSN